MRSLSFFLLSSFALAMAEPLTPSQLTQKHLYLTDLKTGHVQGLTNPVLGDTHGEPFFLDDHHVAFVWHKQDQPIDQLYVLNIDDKSDPYRLTDFPIAASNFKFNAEQLRLVFSAYVHPDAATLQEAKEKDDHDKETIKHDAKVYDQLMVRHWDSYIEQQRNQLFSVDLQLVDGRYQLKNTPRNLLKNTGLQSPGFPSGDASDFDISKNGLEITFVSKISSRDNAWQTSQFVYRLSLESETAVPEVLNDDIEAASSGPVYAPRSGRIAYLQMYVPQYESDRNRIVIYDPVTNKRSVIVEQWDRSPSEIQFSNDESQLFVVAGENGRNKVFAIDLATEAITALTQEHAAASLSVLPDNSLLFGLSSMNHPTIAHTFAANKLNRLGVSDALAKALSETDMSQPEEFEFKGALNDRVHGWIVKPANFDPSLRYPVAFLVHGGPQSAWSDAWSTRWNYHAFANAGAGFIAVAINPHGSTGYGQAFTDAINKNWFTYPYEDLMVGLDHILNTYPYMDGSRVSGLGASYGATMINWINGHTDRFSSLVSHDGIFSTISTYYSTEEVYFPEVFGGPPFNPAARIIYERFSPSNFVHQWKTPTLVIHGGRDFRLPESEGIAVFTALQRRNVASRFVYFPNENHWVLKPANSLKWHQEVLAWMVDYTEKASNVDNASHSPAFQVQQ
ncbi:alpha/beta-hydrolase [Hesseltinella vesiculosa]|uniref:Dipeptidyl-peptidase V n=1 Tax=Hesseltinella vesiculosa TaxID=101127 RepID=A0A1X2GXS8_9FUNG|nr:alpha/beta-hydrolase [Hesseltinella vesiculosa]